MDIYYKYSQHLKNIYGVKTYKISLNLPMTCPNRDGTLGKNGCTFCGESGGTFATKNSLSDISSQLKNSKIRLRDKYGAKKFIAYFQNYSNTYLPLSQLKNYITPILNDDRIVEILFSTRPDCINNKYIEKICNFIKSKNENMNIGLELGLQTVNYHTLKAINRGHTLGEFIDSVMIAKKHNLKIGVHLILNLPEDDKIDTVENAKILSSLKIDNVKLHALYIRKGTKMASEYLNGNLNIIPFEQYRERVITFLEHLSPQIAVQRFMGNAPKEKTHFINWGKNRWKLKNSIIEEMKKQDSYQGKKYDYNNGKALKNKGWI